MDINWITPNITLDRWTVAKEGVYTTEPEYPFPGPSSHTRTFLSPLSTRCYCWPAATVWHHQPSPTLWLYLLPSLFSPDPGDGMEARRESQSRQSCSKLSSPYSCWCTWCSPVARGLSWIFIQALDSSTMDWTGLHTQEIDLVL